MDCSSSGLDFAIIGHQDSWQTITSFINTLRKPDLTELSIEQAKGVFSFIPPRDIYKINITSKSGRQVTGAYIETFIEPDKLTIEHTRKNVWKVMKAVDHAAKLGARIVAMGGFTSIVLEGKIAGDCLANTRFTTGNTLTAAFIVKGVEQAAKQLNLPLSRATFLILGATGDIGLACVNYFKNKVKKLLLCARNKHRLQQLDNDLNDENIAVKSSVCLNELIGDADVIIGVASSSNINLAGCKPGVLICDAGYPKNMDSMVDLHTGINLFHGGMGQVSMGYYFDPDYSKSIYHYPAPGIAHGCILEAMVLAFENKIESYSSGKGNITTDKIEEIFTSGLKHGITLAPFHNANGLWPDQKK